MERIQTIGEEIFNSITHGVGALLVAIGICIGFYLILPHQSFLSIVAFSIYGIALLFMYLISTLYHSIQNKKTKRVFRILDHCSIFLLIAATYTPFTFLMIKTSPLAGFVLLTLVWILAIIGIVLKSVFINKFGKLSHYIYILLGWMGVLFISTIIRTVSLEVILLLFLGGMFYTFGVLFFRAHTIKFHHSIWHFFVILGSLAHFIAVIIIR